MIVYNIIKHIYRKIEYERKIIIKEENESEKKNIDFFA